VVFRHVGLLLYVHIPEIISHSMSEASTFELYVQHTSECLDARSPLKVH
jgi:hypothetical protein